MTLAFHVALTFHFGAILISGSRKEPRQQSLDWRSSEPTPDLEVGPMRSLGLFVSYEPVDEALKIDCWASHCSTAACWMVKLSRPILGADRITLCDKHLYDFESSTRRYT
jgi:hypothetical protein